MTERISPHALQLLVTLLAVWLAGACTGTPIDSVADDSIDSDAPDDEVAELACNSDDATRLYEQRIAPLMTEERVDSCNKCHFAGVELRTFMRETPCDSMACMDKLGIVDLDEPQESLVLSWITRGEPDSELITDSVVAQEHDAFLEWISYQARCGEEVCEPLDPATDPCGGDTTLVQPETSAETLLAGCDEQAITQAFADKVFVWHGRCAHCHSTSYPVPEPLVGILPQWMAPEDHPDAPRRSMLNLLALGAVDVNEPLKSNLLLKPLAIAAGGIEHGGGDKFESTEEAAYQDFKSWIELYTACVTQEPETVPDEPAPTP